MTYLSIMYQMTHKKRMVLTRFPKLFRKQNAKSLHKKLTFAKDFAFSIGEKKNC